MNIGHWELSKIAQSGLTGQLKVLLKFLWSIVQNRESYPINLITSILPRKNVRAAKFSIVVGRVPLWMKYRVKKWPVPNGISRTLTKYHVVSVARWWNKKLPNFLQKVAAHFLHNSDSIRNCPKRHQNNNVTFVIQFVPKNL